MTKVKTRLIALIDFSLYSHALFELASRWCATAGAGLMLVHKVIGLVPAMADSESKATIIEEEKKDALEKLKKWTDEKIAPSTKVDFVVSDRNILVMLSDILEEGMNDFIVVGIKGSGMLKRILMGSVATHIINEMNHTVIAVPERLCVKPGELCNLTPRRIVVTLTDKYPLNETALKNFLKTFKASVQQVTFISVIGEDENAENDVGFLSSLTARYGKSVQSSYKIFRGKNAFEEIKSHVHADNDTVLVVQKGSRTLTDQFFRKFFINQVVNDGSLPMIVLPAE